MPDHHPTLSPSSFPMLAKCPCYQSGAPGEAARAGTRQHALLAAILQSHAAPDASHGCPPEEIEQVEWAADHIRRNTGNGVMVEERMILIDEEFNEITFGALDVVDVVDRARGDCLVVMDYKSGEDHGYLPRIKSAYRSGKARL